DLKSLLSRLVPNPIFIPNDLKTSSLIFLRHETLCKPIQPIYDSPLKVIQRGGKTATILQNGKKSVVSMDRVKPA
ncbi:unnamed protein product, partial [Hymenolepis diminuta]